MKNKTLFIFLYGIVLALAIATLSNLISTLVSPNNVRIAIAMAILISACLFLVLFNYEPSKSPRQLEIALMKRVRSSWLQTLTDLEKSFNRTAPPILILKTSRSLKPDNNTNIRVSTDEKKAAKQVLRAFKDSGGSLGITGKAGSGKTACLLRLARMLIDLAEQDPTEPIPVVFNLSSLNREPLEHWIVRELNARYNISEETGRCWLFQERLVLLLDGLDKDENAAEHIRAINDFVVRKNTTRLVVSGNDLTGLSLQTIARLESANQQESQYVRNGEIFSSADVFIDEQLLKAAELGIRCDSHNLKRRLRWLAQVSRINRRSEFTISQIQPSWLDSKTLEAIYLALSRTVGAGVVMAIGTGILFFSQTILRWVSQNPNLRVEGLFQIENDLECWLLITVFIGGPIIAWLDYHVSKDKSDDSQDQPEPLLNLKHLFLYLGTCTLVFFIFSSLCINRKALSAFDYSQIGLRNPVLGALAFGVAFGLVFWFRSRQHSLASDTNTANKLAWSPVHLLTGSVRWGLPGGWIAGLILSWSLNPIPNIRMVTLIFFLGILFGILSIVSWRGIAKRLPKNPPEEVLSSNRILNAGSFSAILWFGIVVGSASLLVIRIDLGPHPGFHFFILLCSLGAMIGAIASGLRRVNIVETSSSTQGIGLAMRSTLLVWLSVSTPTVLFSWVYGGPIMGKTTQALGSGLFFGLIVGLLFGFAYAGFDVIYRFVFRSILWVNGSAPLMNWTNFLDEAVNLGFLKRVGEAYMFDQKALRKSFANLNKPKLLNERLGAMLNWGRQSHAGGKAGGAARGPSKPS